MLLTYNQVIPSHPTAKNELKTNSKIALMTLAAELSMLPKIARRIIVIVCPTDPKNINFRLPTRSISAIAIKDARKYSVPLHAAIMRDLTSEMPRFSNKIV